MSQVSGVGSEGSVRGGRYLRRLEALETALMEYKVKSDVVEAKLDAVLQWKAAAETWLMENFDVEMDPLAEGHFHVRNKAESDQLSGTSMTSESVNINGGHSTIEPSRASCSRKSPSPVILGEPNSSQAGSFEGEFTIPFVMKTEQADLDDQISITGVRSLTGSNEAFPNGEPSALNPVVGDSPEFEGRSRNSNRARGNSIEEVAEQNCSSSLNGTSKVISSNSVGKKTQVSPVSAGSHSRRGSFKPNGSSLIGQKDVTTNLLDYNFKNGSRSKTSSTHSDQTLRHGAGRSELSNPVIEQQTTPRKRKGTNNSLEKDKNEAVFVSAAVEGEIITDVSVAQALTSTKTRERIMNAEDSTPCDVCGAKEPELENLMVYCESCNVCVHQACYGIRPVPKGTWLCNPCKTGLDTKTLPCYFCPKLGGALKPVRSPAKKHWAHVSCTLWIPEVKLGCADTMEPVININEIPADRWKLKCTICHEKKGAPIQCQYSKKCTRAFHVTCAMQQGLEMQGVVDEAFSQGCQLTAFCKFHSHLGYNSKNEKSPRKKTTSGSPRKRRRTDKW